MASRIRAMSTRYSFQRQLVQTHFFFLQTGLLVRACSNECIYSYFLHFFLLSFFPRELRDIHKLILYYITIIYYFYYNYIIQLILYIKRYGRISRRQYRDFLSSFRPMPRLFTRIIFFFFREFFSYLSLIAFAMVNRGHFLSVFRLFVKLPYFCKYLSRETCNSSRQILTINVLQRKTSYNFVNCNYEEEKHFIEKQRYMYEYFYLFSLYKFDSDCVSYIQSHIAGFQT